MIKERIQSFVLKNIILYPKEYKPSFTPMHCHLMIFYSFSHTKERLQPTCLYLLFLSILCSTIILFYSSIYLDNLSNILILEFMDLLKSS